jgi:hypothetical protein
MAALTDVDICNQALGLVTEAPIQSLEDDTKAARLLNLHYDTTRESELKKHAWSFAILRSSLTAVDAAAMPVGENQVYTYGYEVPPDALRILPLTDTGEAHGVSIPWKMEGGLILTNYAGPRLIRYIGNLVDPADWDSLFVEALTARLAMKIAMPLTQKASFVQSAQTAYNEALQSARRINLIESGSNARSVLWSEARGDTT